MMKKKLVHIFMIGLMAMGSLDAQYQGINHRATMVIANGGLTLREGPSKTSKAMDIIPFGTSIKYLDRKNYGRDSIQIETDVPNANNKIYGYWVKVIHQDQIGYVLDIFLNSKHKSHFQESLPNDYVLLYPGCGCNNENIYNPNEWTWQGYFEKDSSDLQAEIIDISYYRTRNYTCELFLNPSKSEGLQFIIGSKSKRLNQQIIDISKNIILATGEDIGIINERILNLALELTAVQRSDWNTQALFFLAPNKSILMSREHFDYPFMIKFVGDLNGDAINDYIIHYGDKSSVLVLYLSSKENQQVNLLVQSIFYAAYCC